MAQKRAYGVDWDRYREEIMDRYVKQNKTAEDTVKYLSEQHGLHVTLRQFKYEFGRHKNLSVADWRDEILPHVRKRKHEGKESAVYVHKKRICPKRVKQQDDRYPMHATSDISTGNVSTVMRPSASSLEGRICIRTPSPLHSPQLSPRKITANLLLKGQTETESGIKPPPIQQIPLSVPRSSALENFQLNNSIYEFGTPDNIFGNWDEYCDPVGIAFSQDPILSTGDLLRFLPLPNEPIQVPGLNELQYCNFSPQPRVLLGQSNVSINLSKADLLRDLPWFQLRDMVAITPGPNPDSASSPTLDTLIPQTMDGESTETSTFSFMLLKFIGISQSPGSNVMSAIIKTLEEVLPARNVKDQFSRTTQTLAANHVFEVAAFLVSNNKLDERNLWAFIKWVAMCHLEEALGQFLSLKTSTTNGFALKLVGPCARLSKTQFLEKLANLGVSFDHDAIDLMGIKDATFRSFVLSKLTAASLSGHAGTKLLIQAVELNDMQSAQQIIGAGADINARVKMPIFRNRYRVPLLQAVESGSLEMVQLLVENGADINISNRVARLTSWTALAKAVERGSVPCLNYLLENGARVEGQIEGESVIGYAMRFWPEIYHILRQKTASREITSGTILSAAIRLETLSTFLASHQVLDEQAMQAFSSALQGEMHIEAAHLIMSRCLNSCKRVLQLIFNCNKLCIARKAMYTRLLIQTGLDPNVPGILDPLLCDEHWKDGKASELVDILICSGLSLQQHGHFAVEKAFYNGGTDAAVFLIKRGTCINIHGERLTPFQAASLHGSLSLMKDLVDQGAQVNQPAYPTRGLTALQAASLSGCLKKVQYLLSAGAEMNDVAAFVDGATALEAALRPSQFSFNKPLDSCDNFYIDNEPRADIFRFLLKNGAAIDRMDGAPSPLLHDIIERNLMGLLREGLEAGASPNHSWGTRSSSCHARTPLQLAVGLGQLESARLLIEHGADVNAEPAPLHGMTALQAATAAPDASVAMVKFLLGQGAAVDAPAARNGGVTALQGAAIQGHINIALLLFEAGANVNEVPAHSHGRTAIEGAAEHGRLDMVKLLLNAGATGDVLKSTGLRRAQTLAFRNNHSEIAKLLESASIIN